MSSQEGDQRWMRCALNLGRRQLGKTWPNPAVGCVLVKDGRVVSRAVTGTGGRPHAEANALLAAGDAARGCTAYVTLEPCAHIGETPACAELLVDAGISRVVTAIGDPDPRVSGQGIEILRTAGIAVTTGILDDVARETHQGFFSRIKLGRPFLTLKLAMSFDGRIADKNGDSKWITGPASRRRVHLMRARHDAVMVGRGTACADDPNLGTYGLGVDTSPVRIVIDSHLSTPTDSQLGRIAADMPVWICHLSQADSHSVNSWSSCGATTIACKAQGGRVDLSDALQRLARKGLTRIVCEGGAALAATLISSDLVDEIVGFHAGVCLGDAGLSAIGPGGMKPLAIADRFRLISSATSGGDVMHRWARRDQSQD